MKNVIAILIFLAVIVITVYKFFGYQKEAILPATYGVNLNAERSIQDIPIVEDRWTVRAYDSTQIQWTDPSRMPYSPAPKHLWKIVYLKNANRFAEEDAFSYDHTDNIHDRLVVVINLQHPDSSSFSFGRRHYMQYPPPKKRYVAFEFADSVLRSWGFENYYKHLRKNGN